MGTSRHRRNSARVSPGDLRIARNLETSGSGKPVS